MTARVPPFNPFVGETFVPSTEVGVISNTGNTNGGTGGSISVGTVTDSYDAIVVANVFGTVLNLPLNATGVTITAINPGVNYTTTGSQDSRGTNLDGLGGVKITNTSEFDTTFITSDQTIIATAGTSVLAGKAYYIGTDGTHALVEAVIILPPGSVAASAIGNGGTFIIDAVLANNPFITGTTANALGTTFDTQGALPIPCYLRGTQIATPTGERSVETLSIGDMISTATGEERAIRWIGTRSYAGRFAANNPDVLPVVFEAGSIADNVPSRALRVSPDHAMFIDGVLVPAVALVNGSSIRRSEALAEIEYFHVELDSHDILVANGAFAESFVDCDSRNMFLNAGEHAVLYPEDTTAHWTFCAPRVEDGVRVAAIQSRLALRAADTDTVLTRAA